MVLVVVVHEPLRWLLASLRAHARIGPEAERAGCSVSYSS
jgi:hypothetical protein